MEADISWSKYLFQFLLAYETQKVVLIRSKSIGVVYRFVQLSIFVYIALWAMWWERGYQSFDTITSGTSVKISGPSISNVEINPLSILLKPKIWDIADIVIPAQQNSGFFITTNVLVTPNQTQSFCAEAKSVKNSYCKNDSDCVKGFTTNSMHGPFTGVCKTDVNRCEIFGWCPVEEDIFSLMNQTVLNDIVNYTVLISNSVEFRKYGIKRRNILPDMTSEYLQSCRYHPIKDPICPVFRIGDIFGNSQTNLKHILENGGIIAISIDWTCDFDRSIDQCIPKYSFTRLYNDQEDSNINDDDARSAGLASGWNIRYSNQYESRGVKHRILTKAIGVQFFIHTTGKGWRFDLATFTMNCGSGLALFGGAAFFCDMILLYFLKKRKVYRIAKCDKLENSSQ